MAGSKRRREIEHARWERQEERRAYDRAKRAKRRQWLMVAGAAVGMLVVIAGIVRLLPGDQLPNFSPGGDETATSPTPSPSASATPSSSPSSTIKPADCVDPAPGKPSTKKYDAAPTLTFPAGSQVTMTLETTCGDLPIEMFTDKAPKTSGALVTLARDGYYDHSPCHRLTTEGIFILQCGDPTGTGTGDPGFVLPDENTPPMSDDGQTGLYPAGAVAMANKGSGTANAQFFLVYEDTQLPPNYTIVGTLDTDGLALVRQIAAGGTEDGASDGKPALGVVIDSVKVTGAPKAGS